MHIYEDSRRASVERSRDIEDALKRKKYLKEHGQHKLLFGFLGDEPDKEERSTAELVSRQSTVDPVNAVEQVGDSRQARAVESGKTQEPKWFGV